MSIVATALTVTALLLPLPPSAPADPGPVPLGAHASTSARQWAIERPNRGTTRSALVVERAATFPRPLVPWANCVIHRESGGNLIERQSGVRAHNTSGAQGRWQFLASWNHGGPYMVRDRLVQFGMDPVQARKVRLHLSRHPIWKWNGWWQDILFIEVNERGGSFHWDGPGC